MNLLQKHHLYTDSSFTYWVHLNSILLTYERMKCRKLSNFYQYMSLNQHTVFPRISDYSSLSLVRYHWGGQTISNYPYYRINHQRVVIGSEANKTHPLLSSVTKRTPPHREGRYWVSFGNMAFLGWATA